MPSPRREPTRAGARASAEEPRERTQDDCTEEASGGWSVVQAEAVSVSITAQVPLQKAPMLVCMEGGAQCSPD